MNGSVVGGDISGDPGGDATNAVTAVACGPGSVLSAGRLTRKVGTGVWCGRRVVFVVVSVARTEE